jgi:tRNA A-37 threonylcarbamoyl transferase component Bud32
LEREKGLLARAIGLKTARYQVPRVVRLDTDQGVIEFERVPHLKTLRQLVVAGDPRLPQVFNQAGGALAAIHDALELPDHLRTALPPEWMDPDTNACLHGDFTPDNVCIREPDATLVIVDWSTAPLLDSLGTYGSFYFDVLWFLHFLFQCTPPGLYDLREKLADAFLRGYGTATRRELNAVQFDDFRRRFRPLQDRRVRMQTGLRPWFKKIPFRLRQRRVLQAWQRYRLPEV